MSSWYKLSLLCGITPMVVGLTVLFFWIRTRALWLESVGLINIVVGLGFFVCGLVFLVLHYRLKQRNSEVKYGILLPLVVLFLNFPVAFFAVATAWKENSLSVVTINNLSASKISGIAVEQSDDIHILPPMHPGASYSEKIRFNVEGSVSYTITIDGVQSEGLLFGYVTPSIGSHATITINNAGVVGVEQTF